MSCDDPPFQFQSLPHTDELICEYLLFRGFTQCFRVFEVRVGALRVMLCPLFFLTPLFFFLSFFIHSRPDATTAFNSFPWLALSTNCFPLSTATTFKPCPVCGSFSTVDSLLTSTNPTPVPFERLRVRCSGITSSIALLPVQHKRQRNSFVITGRN